MKGQLSSCLTSSTVSCSQADSSWTPWFLPEERRLDEDDDDDDEGERMGRTGLEGLGGGAMSGGKAEEQVSSYWFYWCLAAGCREVYQLWAGVSCFLIGCYLLAVSCGARSDQVTSCCCHLVAVFRGSDGR